MPTSITNTLATLRGILHPLGSPRLGIALIAAFALYAALASLPLIAQASPAGDTVRVPLRQLPVFDMTEGEWFAWWPSVTLLVGVVINMTISMLTRVAWSWSRVSVLLTHAGVALLALGSALYAAQKQEGQIVLSAPHTADEPPHIVTQMTDAAGANPRPIPGIALALSDLSIDTVPGTDLARNVTLTVRATASGSTAEHEVTLNNPLVLAGLAPPTCDCLIRGTIERLWHNAINPVGWKFSIAGWDHEGWLISREAVIAGITDRPRANFVVLGVGNTPGVRIIAAGAILLSLGSAWALLLSTFRTSGNQNRDREGPTSPDPTPTPAPTPTPTPPPSVRRSALLAPILIALALTPTARAAALDPASSLRTLPVQWNGRIAPLDTVARDIVRAVSGRAAVPARGSSGSSEDPLSTLLDLVLNPEAAADRPLISTTGVRLPATNPPAAPLPRLISIQEAERLIESQRRTQPASADDLRHILPLAERLSLARLSARSLPLLAPPRHPGPAEPPFTAHDWLDAESPLAPPPIAAALESLRSAWRDADARRTYLAASHLSESLRQHNHGRYSRSAVWFEAFVNALSPMHWAAWGFTLAAAAGLLAFIARLREPAWQPGDPVQTEPDDPAFAATLHKWLFLFSWLLHAAGFASRWFIAGRLPIQNQYESMLGLCFAATTAAALFVFLAPRRLARHAATMTFASSVVALIVLWASHTLPIPGLAVEPEAAILGTATLLKYHVSTVLVAYAFIAVGGVISATWLIIRAVAPARSHTVQHLAASIPALIKLAFWTLATGILLGALWADRSWGRWWAFDPKETWALITWCVYLVALHWHAAKPLHPQIAARTRPLAWLCVLGTLIMLWSWFGVNLLLPGLHAYA